LIAIVTLVGLAALWPPSQKIKLGIDLSGGTILVYQAKQSETQRSEFDMDELIAALKKRINPEGTKDIVIRKVGGDRVEIILPLASPEEVEDVKRRMTAVGSMQFRILADSRDRADEQPIKRVSAEAGIAKAPRGYRWAKLGEIVRRSKSDAPSRPWVTLDRNTLTDVTQSWARDRYVGAGLMVTAGGSSGLSRQVTLPIIANDAQTLTVDPARAQVSTGPGRFQTRAIPSLESEFKTIDSYQIVLNPSRVIEDANLAIRAIDRGNGVEERYVLCKIDNQDVTGDMLRNVYPTQDEAVQPAVGFIFNPQGANKFGRLTREYSPGKRGGDFKYHLAILLDDMVMSAPVINQEIRESGIIEGMPLKQRDELIDILRAGKLPASIDPIPLQQETIGPTLGKDTVEKGLRAIFVSMLVVPLFMIVYYRFAGVVAVVCLLLNIILLVGSMAFTSSSFTLPGLAGLALTIGMAVDANVLIFERMREEKERGANMSTQIRNGFNRAWSTILDSNLTTVLSGLVLWWIGTEEIKGFALTLIIGLVWNLFTAVFVSRVIFEFFYQKGWLKKLTMMQLFGKTNIDFTRPRRYLMAVSAVLITAGLVYFASKGQNSFNIDFTGGTMLTMQLRADDPAIVNLTDSQRAAYVREKASDAVLPNGSRLPNVSVESLFVSGEARGTRFNVRTTWPQAEDVQQAILQQFGDSLARLSVSIGEPVPIPKIETPTPGAGQRFAGGHRYTLTFNREVDPKLVSLSMANFLREQRIANPESRFSIERVSRAEGSSTGDRTSRLVLSTDLGTGEAQSILGKLAEALPKDPSLTFERREAFGAAVARDTQLLAMVAIVASWLVIIAYLWFRFKSMAFGLAAVVALVHDVLFTLGVVSLSPYKIDLPMIAAFLTLIGFSVNDTIVIFDRIREIKGKTPYVTEGIINAAVNQTFSRTIITSFTAWLVVVIMYFFGGEGLQGFSFCLVVGFLTGIYSTVYIASPILLEWLGKKTPKAAEKPTAVAAASR
jgi:SecD/SecF fusion protein